MKKYLLIILLALFGILYVNSQQTSQDILKTESHVNINQNEKNALLKVLKLYGAKDYYIMPNIPDEELINAKQLCITPSEEEIYALIDAWPSKSYKRCKGYLLIGSSGIFIYNLKFASWCPGRYFIPYDVFQKLSIKVTFNKENDGPLSISPSAISIAGISFDMGACSISEELLISLLQDVQKVFQKPITQLNTEAQQQQLINKQLQSQDTISYKTTESNDKVIILADVDVNIPERSDQIFNLNTYALIIGNEDYSSFQTGLSKEANVDYAVNDATIFKEYLIKTVGVPEKNITFKPNATLGQMRQAISKLAALAEIKEGEAELIFYYSGHGLPDETTREPYLIPVDVSGTDIKSAIKLDEIYNQLSEFPTKWITIFLDACFSGGARNQPLVAMRSVRIPPKTNTLNGNLIVFSSSSGEESSGAYKDKQHGMFTYFLLKKLQETKGDVTYRELSDYLYNKVREESVLVNEKVQTPQTNISQLIQSE